MFSYFLGRNSLRARVRRWLALFVLLVVTILVVGISLFVYETEQEAWHNRQQEATHIAALTIENFMERVDQHMRLVGALDVVYLFTAPDTLDRLLAQEPALLEVIRLDADGTVISSAYQEDSTALLANLFTIRQANWFQQARSGESYVGNVEISAASKPYLILSAPATEGGVVAARLDMSVLWRVVSEIHFGDTGQVYIVSSNGVVIAHADPEIVLNVTTVTGGREALDARAAWSGSYRNFEDTPVVAVALPIAGSEWTIYAENALSEVTSTTRLALLVLGGTTILLGLVFFMANERTLVRIILRRLATLRSGAQRIGQGDLAFRLEVDRPDEIGQVAIEFNSMAAQLQEREKALAQARDEALEASNFKSRLLANVSHDLRTPINAMMGLAEMLKAGLYGPLEEKQLIAAKKIVSNNRKLNTLINNLLDRAQIEAGKIVLHYQRFDPAMLVEDTIDALEMLARDRGLTLTANIDEHLPETLTGDTQQLQRVIFNLVENAIKYTDSGSVNLSLYPEDDNWAIKVTDTGRGIASADHASVFEPFHQADEANQHKRVGVGLGLSIVSQLVEMMGGSITLTSQLNEGSTFTVLLPYSPPGAEE